MDDKNIKSEYLTGSDGKKYKVILSSVEDESVTNKPQLKRLLTRRLLALLFITLLLATSAYFFLTLKPSTPISKYKKSLDFTLYFPEELPPGYAFEQGSIQLQNNILFFKIKNNDQNITISEQAVPGNLPDLKTATGFVPQGVPIGTSYSGITPSGLPASILVTSTSLININGTEKVTTKTLDELVYALKRVK